MISVGNVEIKSSKISVDEFISSTLWADLQAILRDWAEGVKLDAMKERDVHEIMRCQGRVEALEYFLTVPETMSQAAEFETKEET